MRSTDLKTMGNMRPWFPYGNSRKMRKIRGKMMQLIRVNMSFTTPTLVNFIGVCTSSDRII